MKLHPVCVGVGVGWGNYRNFEVHSHIINICSTLFSYSNSPWFLLCETLPDWYWSIYGGLAKMGSLKTFSLIIHAWLEPKHFCWLSKNGLFDNFSPWLLQCITFSCIEINQEKGFFMVTIFAQHQKCFNII